MNTTPARNLYGNRNGVGTARAGGRHDRDVRVLDGTAQHLEAWPHPHLIITGGAHGFEISAHLGDFGATVASRCLGGDSSRARMSVGIG